MEFNKTEAAVIENAVAESAEIQVRELDELQLALIGGGAGEAYFG